VVQPDNIAQPRDVDAKPIDENVTIVAKGLSPDERVVVNGQSRLEAGVRVEPRSQEPRVGFMNISEPFIRRPVATSLLMMALAVAGIAAFPLLPVAPLPQVDFPTVQVAAALPGASPETMAATVAQPLERQFAQISGLTDMTSTSTLGSTSIVLQFDLDRNVDAAAQDVQAAITAANRQLPTDLPSPPIYRKANPADSPILVIAAYSDTMPITIVDDLADTVIAQQISQIKGVAQVVIGGEQSPRCGFRSTPPNCRREG
jgi:multidrug efflux pump subunit AcrB